MTDAIALPGAPLPMSPPSEARLELSQHEAELRRAAEEFEAIFLAQMMAPMFEGLETDGLGGGGMGEQIFRPMLIERYAEALAHAGGVGIADAVVRELLRLQQTITPPGAGNGADR